MRFAKASALLTGTTHPFFPSIIKSMFVAFGTIRAGLDAMLAFGRPNDVELLNYLEKDLDKFQIQGLNLNHLFLCK